MKYILCVLLSVTLCACFRSKANNDPLPHGYNWIARNEVDAENSSQASYVDDKSATQLPFSGRGGRGSYEGVTDLSKFIAFLGDPSVKSLKFYSGTFSDLSPLATLTGLEELEISGNRNVTNISPLSSLVNLKSLTLWSLSLESIEPLSSLVNLRYLELSDAHEHTDFRELLPLQQLETLRLYMYNRPTLDVACIAQLQSLTELNITPGIERSSSATKVMKTNIKQLQNLINLENLAISGVDLDISWITQLQKLQKISLRYCEIDDISPLAKLPNLVDVYLYESEVRDITPLLESRSIKKIEQNVDSYTVCENHNILIDMFMEQGIEFRHFHPIR
ncbi:MAG: hypothetical protein LBH44_05540 [Treponema sp.]|jgi:Leucine-rich repeat (LRR) protein|nr:hypothetical protein [Treponema sp.]